MSDNIPQSINYTNRDFYSLRDDLIKRVQQRVATDSKGNPTNKQWNATDPSDFGVAIVEAFAFIGDMANYYIDRAANEAVLGTAVQRQSLLDFASLFGYKPAGYRQATVSIDFTNNSSTAAFLPSGTRLTTAVASGDFTTTLYFTLVDDLSIPPGATRTQLAAHGQDVSLLNPADPTKDYDIAGELLGSSSGAANQSFTLAFSPVVLNTLQVYVYDGTAYVQWTIVDRLQDYSSSDTVVTTVTDSNDVVYVVFGDGVNGAIPITGSPIKATYVTGGGLVGNVTSGQTFYVDAIPGGTTSGLAISAKNASNAIGGEDAESNDSIRVNAPKALQALNRAVSLADYSTLALGLSGVGKAYAYASQPGSVLVYTGPTVSPSSNDYYPGYSSYTSSTVNVVSPSWTALQASLTSYFSDKTQIGTTVTFAPPAYVNAVAAIQFRAMPGYDYTQIVNNLKYAIVYGFGYNFLDFNEVIFPETIDAALNSAPGVAWAKTDSLYRAGDSVSRSNLIPVAANGEFFVFTDSNTAVYPTASLKTLAASGTGTTISPVFYPHILSYTINVQSSTTSITLTPTSWDSSWVIKVNGAVVTSGSASSSISLASGTTTKATITVTTADGTYSNTYALSIVRP